MSLIETEQSTGMTQEIATPHGDELTAFGIEERGQVGGKPRFIINSERVINCDSGFKEKLLCDGLTFTAGHACVFSCSFCYVEAITWPGRPERNLMIDRRISEPCIFAALVSKADLVQAGLFHLVDGAIPCGRRPRLPDSLCQTIRSTKSLNPFVVASLVLAPARS